MTAGRFLYAGFFAGILALPAASAGQTHFYVGSLGGVNTLSADARTVVEPPLVASSSYRPDNGPVVNPFIGIRLSDFLSLQADYFWNRNQLKVGSVSPAFSFEQRRTSAQHGLFGHVLVYFRESKSWVRPYLSAGPGVTRFASKLEHLTIFGGPVTPPVHFSATKAALLVTVGVDLRLRNGWAIRYSFGETISGNPISDQLSPPGNARLKNFRNLFGFVRYF